MQGKLGPGVLPVVLRDVYARRQTGSLHFLRDAEHCGIRFVHGHIVYGAASAPELHLGEVLVAQGLLSQENLDRATEVVHREHVRLGEALQGLGIVDSELLEEFLALHVKAILVSLFSWRSGSYDLEEQDPGGSLAYDFPLKSSTGEMILEATREVTDRDAILFGLGDLDRVLLPATEPLVRFQRVTLTPVDGFVLSRVDGALSAQEIIGITPLPHASIEASLLALLATGLVEYASDQPKGQERASTAQFLRQEILDAEERSRGGNPFEILGVPYEATDAEVKAAYMRLAKRYHPDVHHEPALADLRDRLEALFFRVGEAFQAIGDPMLRLAQRARLDPSRPVPAASRPSAAAPEPRVSPRHAEDMLRRAEERFQDGRYWEAVAVLQETIGLASGRVRQRARVLLARTYLKYPESTKQAEKVLLTELREDPDNVDALFYLGCLYKRTGLESRALGMFRRVLEIRPKHREALAEVAGLGPAEPEEKPGLLKRLLGKD